MAGWSGLTQAENYYRIYLAVKLHFTLEKYDYLNTKGNISNIDKLIERSEVNLAKYFLDICDTPRKFLRFSVANFLHQNDRFIYEENDRAESNYRSFEKFSESNHFFKSDLTLIGERVYNSGGVEHYIKNDLINDLYSGSISYETIVLLNQQNPDFTGLMSGYFADKMCLRIRKASTFLPLSDEHRLTIKDTLV